MLTLLFLNWFVFYLFTFTTKKLFAHKLVFNEKINKLVVNEIMYLKKGFNVRAEMNPFSEFCIHNIDR